MSLATFFFWVASQSSPFLMTENMDSWVQENNNNYYNNYQSMENEKQVC